MLLVRLLLFPFKAAVVTTGVTFRTGFRAGRLLGYRRLAVFGAGVGVGLLLAPVPGHQLRQRLNDLVEGRRRPPDGDLDERVRFELSHSPRTWHLPQPDVEVVGGRVTLGGEVPHETARQELQRAAEGVAGVAQVDNRITVTPTSAAS